jgi:hypothetical protein
MRSSRINTKSLRGYCIIHFAEVDGRVPCRYEIRKGESGEVEHAPLIQTGCVDLKARDGRDIGHLTSPFVDPSPHILYFFI